jgi:hypothetical protein
LGKTAKLYDGRFAIKAHADTTAGRDLFAAEAERLFIDNNPTMTNSLLNLRRGKDRSRRFDFVRTSYERSRGDFGCIFTTKARKPQYGTIQSLFNVHYGSFC